jgi:hypothetical protein
MVHNRYARTFSNFRAVAPNASTVKTKKQLVKPAPEDDWGRISINVDPELKAIYEAYVKSLRPRRSLSSHIAALIERDLAKKGAASDFEQEGADMKNSAAPPPKDGNSVPR